ncbi:MAG: helix-turn-helix domain-containing protein [Christensenella sp.]|uniref:helix-turn-helix domain-containing protein n=1 Tax=Christensenella sp. TaxID=1935934 RepID=UPI002B1FD95A|nr:helix-turn-helix domain-containing protein [Christensenella sp.]MEA5002047.1 helix-turn-helix domain-containing protein [Christensenella sp.]
MRIKKFMQGLTGTMQRRLLLYTFILILLLITIFMGVVMLFGRFSVIEQDTSASLSLHLSVYEQDITSYFDHVAARGIQMSEELGSKISDWLKDEKYEFSELNGDPDAIALLEQTLNETIYTWLKQTDCSGVYFLFDATANPALPNAGSSRAGTYIKIANVNVQRPADPKLVLFRGYTDVGRSRHLELHNMWKLEYNTDDFPSYDMAMSKANPDLNSCFIFTNTAKLPGTWEDVMLLCVPIVANDGTVYGICGFEISAQYYKLRFAHTETLPNLMGILARREGTGIDVSSGLTSGHMAGYHGNMSGSSAFASSVDFQEYTVADGGAYIGVETPVRISPLGQEHIVAVMIPKADYDAEKSRSDRENLVIILLLILSAVLGSMVMSKMYVAPILRGLKDVKSGKTSGGIGLLEIDDLLEYLAALDDERETLATKLEQSKLHATEQDAGLKSTDQNAPIVTAYERFLENLNTLTMTEEMVFNLYMKKFTAAQIADELFISINTVKFHNRNIYAKLGVSSLKELMVYVNMMNHEQ